MQRWNCSRTCFMALWAVCLVAGLAVLAAPAGAQISATACNGPGSCDDGLYCNGEETCTINGCLNGGNPCPGRGCDEGLDICLPGQNPQLEGGWVGVGGTPETVLLTNSYERPVVVLGLHYQPTDPPMVARVR